MTMVLFFVVDACQAMYWRCICFRRSGEIPKEKFGQIWRNKRTKAENKTQTQSIIFSGIASEN